MRRIAVVGTSGSGKTTFSVALAARLGLPRIELDGLYWEAGWTEADADVFRDRVRAAITADAWVCDGNYSAVRPLVLDPADTIIWLDLPMRVCLWRVIVRTARRVRSREDLWGTGNRDTWRKQLGRDSLILWVLTTHRRRRREYAARFGAPDFRDKEILRFRSARDAERWLADVHPSGVSSDVHAASPDPT